MAINTAVVAELNKTLAVKTSVGDRGVCPKNRRNFWPDLNRAR